MSCARAGTALRLSAEAKIKLAQPIDPAKFDPAKFDPAKFDPAKFDPAKFDPAKARPARRHPLSSLAATSIP
jgi:hypothetical protein